MKVIKIREYTPKEIADILGLKYIKGIRKGKELILICEDSDIPIQKLTFGNLLIEELKDKEKKKTLEMTEFRCK